MSKRRLYFVLAFSLLAVLTAGVAESTRARPSTDSTATSTLDGSASVSATHTPSLTESTSGTVASEPLPNVSVPLGPPSVTAETTAEVRPDGSVGLRITLRNFPEGSVVKTTASRAPDGKEYPANYPAMRTSGEVFTFTHYAGGRAGNYALLLDVAGVSYAATYTLGSVASTSSTTVTGSSPTTVTGSSPTTVSLPTTPPLVPVTVAAPPVAPVTVRTPVVPVAPVTTQKIVRSTASSVRPGEVFYIVFQDFPIGSTYTWVSYTNPKGVTMATNQSASPVGHVQWNFRMSFPDAPGFPAGTYVEHFMVNGTPYDVRVTLVR